MMIEWHVDPVYVTENWTDELLDLMIEKHNERQIRLSEPRGQEGARVVPAEELFRIAGKRIKVVKNAHKHR